MHISSNMQNILPFVILFLGERLSNCPRASYISYSNSIMSCVEKLNVKIQFIYTNTLETCFSRENKNCYRRGGRPHWREF